jgi:hypothetical protein
LGNTINGASPMSRPADGHGLGRRSAAFEDGF